MPKPSTVAKKTTNQLLSYIADKMKVDAVLPPEQQLAVLCGVSRTTIRSAITHLHQLQVINGIHDRRLLRMPVPEDYFDLAELQTGTEKIQQVLLERVFQKDLPPGAEFSESELAREAGASTVSVREFLIGFSRYGLIEKKPNGGWRLCAFDLSFAEELAEMRQLFEIAAIEKFASLDDKDDVWKQLDKLIVRHEKLKAKVSTKYSEFPALDRDFHTLLIGILRNRFAQGFYDIVSFVFHYHYQWDKRDEMARNSFAIDEHLEILKALAKRDIRHALDSMRQHLKTSRATLMHAIRTKTEHLAS
ncbi:GntR family transcriptional regulator [Leeia oryzae]|uniref:GntR family transcriptional regulator n=1 Tax=Leeia oryzae TaxID=356662 RepID=UPI00037C8C19|nr:GntR family transcriptional regulator [Leeia oryzae]